MTLSVHYLGIVEGFTSLIFFNYHYIIVIFKLLSEGIVLRGTSCHQFTFKYIQRPFSFIQPLLINQSSRMLLTLKRYALKSFD